jgi:hypothetical protein
VKRELWDQGVRVVEKGGQIIKGSVTHFMESILHITDPIFQDTIRDHLTKLLLNRGKRLWHNMISKYRQTLKKQCESKIEMHRPSQCLVRCHSVTHSVTHSCWLSDLKEVLAVPEFDLVMVAIKKDPEDATQEEIAAMKFFLGKVLPCVDANQSKKLSWMSNGSTCKKLPNNWNLDAATALVLMNDYSCLENVEHNAAVSDGETDSSKKRKRSRLRSPDKANVEKTSQFYRLCSQLKEIQQGGQFEQRMVKWQDTCEIAKTTTNTRGPNDRLNIVPDEHRQHARDASETDGLECLRSLGLARGLFVHLPSMEHIEQV